MEKITIYAPYDRSPIAELQQNSLKDAKKALNDAREIFLDRNRWLSKAERLDILKRAHRMVFERREELAKTAAQEGGKPLIDSRIEANRAASGIEAAIASLYNFAGEEIPMELNQASMNRLAYTFYEPRGVVLAISAFNHPLNLIIHQVIPSIAAGCPVIIKPSSLTPLSCKSIVEILYEAGLPKAWCQMLIVDNEVSSYLAQDPKISFLSFIGSGKVGWMLRSRLAPGVTCSLEHGGAAPVLIDKTADMQDALNLIVKGAFYHAGQVCVSVQRIFIHEDVCHFFAEQLKNRALDLVVGDPTSEKTEVGPLISEQEVARVDEWVKEAVSLGATLLCGGRKISSTLYAPTVLLNAPMEAKVSKYEIFGPVVCIYSVKDMDQAIVKANALDFSFQAAIFTKNIDQALKASRLLAATAVMVNDHSAFRVDWMPFGGEKLSGLGMGGIAYSMESMSIKKMMVIKSKYW